MHLINESFCRWNQKRNNIESPFRRVEEEASDIRTQAIRFLFPQLMRRLREEQHWSVGSLARKLEINRSEILAWEQSNDYELTASQLSKLSEVSNIPSENLCMLIHPTHVPRTDWREDPEAVGRV